MWSRRRQGTKLFPTLHSLMSFYIYVACKGRIGLHKLHGWAPNILTLNFPLKLSLLLAWGWARRLHQALIFQFAVHWNKSIKGFYSIFSRHGTRIFNSCTGHFITAQLTSHEISKRLSCLHRPLQHSIHNNYVMLVILHSSLGQDILWHRLYGNDALNSLQVLAGGSWDDNVQECPRSHMQTDIFVWLSCAKAGKEHVPN